MMKTIKSKLNQKGFSLIELMVVIVIMLILAAIAIPAFMGVVKDARETKATAEVRTVLMLAQLAVNKDNLTAVDLDTTNYDGEGTIFEQAGITDPTEQGYYKSSTVTDGKVTIVYDDGNGTEVTLPESAAVTTP